MKQLAKYTIRILILIATTSFASASDIRTPSDFLGYQLGSAFTYHHKVQDYFEYVSEVSPNVQLQEYGQTYERRELNVAFISSAQNLEKLEEIRMNNLRRTGLIKGSPAENDISIVWLSYNVHGNEANSTETAMKVLYELASGGASMNEEWLDKMVIILDPCLNPDGRDRYVNWYNQVGNATPNPNLITREHHEGWSHGRSNHYQFDLNRDWVWLTQIESKQRLKLYNEWLPHVHVDLHEMFIDNHYYFAPASEPLHEVVTDWQREFQVIVGKNNAKHFDENGWLYFTREYFDLLYPGYGDTYPTFNGGIGMTYEMAGHSRAGLAANTIKGDTLTLRDRIDRHFTSSMATLETCFEQRTNLISNFTDFYKSNAKSNTSYILRSPFKDRIDQLRRLLDAHKISHKTSAVSTKVRAKDFDNDQRVDIQVEKGDFIVPQDQPKSALVKVLFERNTKLVDSMTYDITAWSLPFVYGLKAYTTQEQLQLIDYPSKQNEASTLDSMPYAYVLNWTSLEDARFLSAILQKGIKVNVATRAFQYDGKNYNAGSLVINKIDNVNGIKNHNAVIQEIAHRFHRDLAPLTTGSALNEFDLGSNKVKYTKMPRIALLAGRGIDPYSFGELWYFLEQEINYQADVIEKRMFNQMKLDDYDVLILASGSYPEMQEDAAFAKLKSWIKAGGRLILLNDAISGFIGEKKFALEAIDSDQKSEDKSPRLYAFADEERENLKSYINGGIIKLEVDNTHPLAFGYEKHYYTLKNNGPSYKFLTDGWNVAYIPASENLVAGFVGSDTKEMLDKNLVFGVEQQEKGKVIYFADNPIFRGFWQNGKLFLANAIFFSN